jgi:hypothetical protein
MGTAALRRPMRIMAAASSSCMLYGLVVERGVRSRERR